MVTFVLFVLVAVGMWGQYWYDRAHRLQDTITYMVMEEIEEEEEEEV